MKLTLIRGMLLDVGMLLVHINANHPDFFSVVASKHMELLTAQIT